MKKFKTYLFYILLMLNVNGEEPNKMITPLNNCFKSLSLSFEKLSKIDVNAEPFTINVSVEGLSNSGVSPSSVRDPELRKRYEDAIAANNIKIAKMNKNGTLADEINGLIRKTREIADESLNKQEKEAIYNLTNQVEAMLALQLETLRNYKSK